MGVGDTLDEEEMLSVLRTSGCGRGQSEDLRLARAVRDVSEVKRVILLYLDGKRTVSNLLHSKTLRNTCSWRITLFYLENTSSQFLSRLFHVQQLLEGVSRPTGPPFQTRKAKHENVTHTASGVQVVRSMAGFSVSVHLLAHSVKAVNLEKERV